MVPMLIPACVAGRYLFREHSTAQHSTTDHPYRVVEPRDCQYKICGLCCWRSLTVGEGGMGNTTYDGETPSTMQVSTQ